MNTEHLSRGWALIAEGAQYLSMAYASNDSPAARAGVGPGATGAEAHSPAPSVAPVPSFDELPPEGFEANIANVGYSPQTSPEPRLNPQVEAGLGKCPVHGKPWLVKPAGTNAAGKSWDAFWKCGERDESSPSGWCKQKPQKIWKDLHPIPNGVAA